MEIRSMNDPENWLLVGGAGYVGAHVADAFGRAGIPHVVLDNLSTGLPVRLPTATRLVEGDARDIDVVAQCIRDFRVAGIVHLAALKNARESVVQASRYWHTNIGALSGVLTAMAQERRVRSFVLSSSCSVYGSISGATTNSPLRPESPYGKTKVVSEEMVTDCALELGYSWTSLRYFNVIGCGDFANSYDIDDRCLIPQVTRSIRENRSPKIFGNGHPTPDGTCLRDYIDVRDVAEAHVLAAVTSTDVAVGHGRVVNLSSGAPRSVLEVVTEMLRLSGSCLAPDLQPARAGDPYAAWAEPSDVGLPGWRAKYSLSDSIRSHLVATQTRDEP